MSSRRRALRGEQLFRYAVEFGSALGDPGRRVPGAAGCRDRAPRKGHPWVAQNWIELMVSATELRNRWMSSAMPVEARKKPKSTATTAGPPLIDPPRINTTRTIPNRSTTDSEMATTDHTLRSVRSPGPEVQPRAPPPEPSCHQRARRMRRVSHRSVTEANGRASYGNSSDPSRGKFRKIVSMSTQSSTQPVRSQFELLPQAQRRD